MSTTGSPGGSGELSEAQRRELLDLLSAELRKAREDALAAGIPEAEVERQFERGRRRLAAGGGRGDSGTDDAQHVTDDPVELPRIAQ